LKIAFKLIYFFSKRFYQYVSVCFGITLNALQKMQITVYIQIAIRKELVKQKGGSICLSENGHTNLLGS